MFILAPVKENDSIENRISNLVKMQPLEPFESVILEFISELSRRILSNNLYRRYPELIALAFWMRKSHLKNLEEQYLEMRRGRLLVPRGVVLHFAPSNVDSIFIYSWFISLLVGNSNIVRVSQQRGEQINILIDLLSDLLSEENFKVIQDRTAIITYPHNEDITRFLSENCNTRVIWGGDETIKRIRSVPLRANATEMVFADKYSLSAIDARALLELSNTELNQIAQNFYNDAYWFDQMACSSPRLIIWSGVEIEIERAKALFWDTVEQIVSEKQEKLNPSVGMTKLVTGYQYSAKGFFNRLSTNSTQGTYRADLKSLDLPFREIHCGGGFFLESHVENILEMVDFVDIKDQTLSVFGFSEEELRKLVQVVRGRGIDRIVSIGQSLNFDNVWDGYNLFENFSKEITIKLQSKE